MYNVENIIKDINRNKYKDYDFVISTIDMEAEGFDYFTKKYVIYYYDFNFVGLKNATGRILYKDRVYHDCFGDIVKALVKNNIKVSFQSYTDPYLKVLMEKYIDRKNVSKYPKSIEFSLD